MSGNPENDMHIILSSPLGNCRHFELEMTDGRAGGQAEQLRGSGPHFVAEKGAGGGPMQMLLKKKKGHLDLGEYERERVR